MKNYTYPEVLVSTDWVKENLGRPGIKLVEIDVDTKAYEAGHIPRSVGFNWQTQLQDQVGRDIISKAAFERLLGQAGISLSDTVVCYGPRLELAQPVRKINKLCEIPPNNLLTAEDFVP